MHEGFYDIVKNNCAGKVINVLDFLGLWNSTGTQTSIRTFLISVFSSDAAVLGLVKGSTNLKILFPGLTNAQVLAKKNDAQIVTALVDYGIAYGINWNGAVSIYSIQLSAIIIPLLYLLFVAF